jgi:hypothetical protein
VRVRRNVIDTHARLDADWWRCESSGCPWDMRQSVIDANNSCYPDKEIRERHLKLAGFRRKKVPAQIAVTATESNYG